jgi:hypothetical protein
MISIESYRASIGSFNSCQNGSNWARSSSGGIPPMTPEEFTRKKKLHDMLVFLVTIIISHISF